MERKLGSHPVMWRPFIKSVLCHENVDTRIAVHDLIIFSKLVNSFKKEYCSISKNNISNRNSSNSSSGEWQ